MKVPEAKHIFREDSRVIRAALIAIGALAWIIITINQRIGVGILVLRATGGIGRVTHCKRVAASPAEQESPVQAGVVEALLRQRCCEWVERRRIAVRSRDQKLIARP